MKSDFSKCLHRRPKQSQLSNVRNERRRCKTIRRGEENLYSLFLKIISQSLIRSEIFLLSSLPACFMMFLRESRFEVVKNKPSATVTSLCSRFDFGVISWSGDNGRSRSLIEPKTSANSTPTIKAIANCNQQTPDVVERIFIGPLVGKANKTNSASAKIRKVETGRQTLYVSRRGLAQGWSVVCILRSSRGGYATRFMQYSLKVGLLERAWPTHISWCIRKSYVIGRASTTPSSRCDPLIASCRALIARDDKFPSVSRLKTSRIKRQQTQVSNDRESRCFFLWTWIIELN